MESFGERLRKLRKEKNITLDKMAEDLATTKATLSRYENNLRDPKTEFASKVAEYLGVTMDYLIGSPDNKLDSRHNEFSKKEEGDLSPKDLKQIEKDLENMMDNIKSKPDEGFASYDGNSNIDEDDLALLEDAFRTALRVVKKLNKETYTPKKYKK